MNDSNTPGKRSSITETLALALELTRHIPRGRKVSAADLQQKLEHAGHARNLRSIQRLLDTLSRQGFIERDERNKPYGYSWPEKAPALAVPNLTPQESLLLQLAHEQLRHLLPASLMRGMDGFFDQARRNLSPASDNAVLEKQWPAKVRVVATSQPLLPPKLRPGVFDTVSEALYANRWLLIEYQNAKGEFKKKEVMPLGLAQQGPRLYLVCRFQGYDNERSLALHRMHSAQIGLPFERPRNFDLQQFDEDGRFGISKGRRVRLSFRIRKGVGLHLLESPLSKDQTVEEAGEDYRITATVAETVFLAQWLRGFGDAIADVSLTPIPPDEKPGHAPAH